MKKLALNVNKNKPKQNEKNNKKPIIRNPPIIYRNRYDFVLQRKKV